MGKEKVVNYTEEMTKRVVSRYEEGTTDSERKEILQELSAETGKKVPSLIAKLVREGVYQKPGYVSKAKNAVETKDTIVASIAGILGVTEAQLNGLEKATKPTLELIRAQFIEAALAVENAFKEKGTLPDSE